MRTDRTPPPHGTRARYERSDPCRCDRCRQANATYQRAYRRHGTGSDDQLALWTS